MISQIWALGKQALSAGMLVIDVEHGEVRPWPPETLDDLHSRSKSITLQIMQTAP